ncbi:hypothetical protein PAHAL_6G171300 [Panicum hallii]|uniref:Uncharacterized protein n=1 Tax=Panicum hallii TaxID=206008 RepID=A0A2T8IGK0_9POAL|nr:hypothetical protein PAHAL_6G171300 [Panicum hallii]
MDLKDHPVILILEEQGTFKKLNTAWCCPTLHSQVHVELHISCWCCPTLHSQVHVELHISFQFILLSCFLLLLGLQDNMDLKLLCPY